MLYLGQISNNIRVLISMQSELELSILMANSVQTHYQASTVRWIPELSNVDITLLKVDGQLAFVNKGTSGLCGHNRNQILDL